MNVLVAGGTGFIGRHLVRELIGAGHYVLLIQRPASRTIAPTGDRVRPVKIDPAFDIAPQEFSVDAIINLVGIIREFPSKGITFHEAHVEVTKNLVDFARQAGAARFLQMSALGVSPDARGGYMQSKRDAERQVMESGLEWVIFRPSVVFGLDDHIVTLFSKLLGKLPVIGVVGDGQYKLQPVHVSNVCAGFVRALNDDRAIGKIFEFGGPEIMTFNKMLDLIGEALGKRKVRKMHISPAIMKVAASLLKSFENFPITPEQIDMLLRGNYTDDNSYYEFLGRPPIGFESGIAEFLKPANRA
jgi:NADH dehydrogenase